MAHAGTFTRLSALGLVALAVSCSASHGRAGLDAEVQPWSDAAVRDAPSSPEPEPSHAAGCTADEECSLVPRACCGCRPTLDNMRGVHIDDEAAALTGCAGVLCGECEVRPHDPLAAWPAPVCIEGQCSVRDLRRADETLCTDDNDCQLSPPKRSCCGSCISDPRSWQALRKGANVHLAGRGCSGDVFCDDCKLAYPPAFFCASDGHCAVRATPAIDDEPNAACFAPGYRAETAALPTARGCDCFPGDPEVCDPLAGALFCEDGSWQAGFDGPCSIH